MGEDETLAQLIGRVAERDRAAFRQLFDLTSSRIVAVCLRRLKRRDLAEEAAQDAYVSI